MSNTRMSVLIIGTLGEHLYKSLNKLSASTEAITESEHKEYSRLQNLKIEDKDNEVDWQFLQIAQGELKDHWRSSVKDFLLTAKVILACPQKKEELESIHEKLKNLKLICGIKHALPALMLIAKRGADSDDTHTIVTPLVIPPALEHKQDERDPQTLLNTISQRYLAEEIEMRSSHGKKTKLIGVFFDREFGIEKTKADVSRSETAALQRIAMKL